MVSQLPSFDRLMELAQNNPTELEAIRQALSEEIIQSASPQFRQRLEGLNFRINMERQRCKTPLQSCMRMTDLMHDSFDEMRHQLDVLLHNDACHLQVVGGQNATAAAPVSKAEKDDTVVPFRRP